MHPLRFRSLSLMAALALAALVAACSSAPSDNVPDSLVVPSAYAPYTSYAPSSRPSTAAKVSIVSPTADEVITGSTLHVVVSLTGATIVPDTNEDIRPDQGHVHLYLDNTLVYMQYSLTKDLPITPGTHVLKAEFVANDHAPFNPRDWSTQVFFTSK
jgi:hypothetical protein